MNKRLRCAIIALRWSVGLVILCQSLRFVLSKASAHRLHMMGLPHWLRPGLGIAEIVAAIIFLIPRGTRVGGYLLLLALIFAAVLHVLHGQYDIGMLIVYCAAIFVCVSADI
jgi:uncharacterized membrane protein YphA (DoxX/SURF4 family)